MTIAAGIDVGTGAVKAALFRVDDNGNAEWLSRAIHRIRQRDPMELARVSFDAVLADAGVAESDVDYIATTGEGEGVQFHTGHFYSMTTHARGAIYLEPEARAVLDAGALHGRAISIDGRGKVLSYKMTSQCASGSGQFLENIARYLGVAQDEIGSLSRRADAPEIVSSICAVLAETDAINMVSRGISAPNILKGIHLSMAGRLSKLRAARARGHRCGRQDPLGCGYGATIGCAGAGGGGLCRTGPCRGAAGLRRAVGCGHRRAVQVRAARPRRFQPRLCAGAFARAGRQRVISRGCGNRFIRCALRSSHESASAHGAR